MQGVNYSMDKYEVIKQVDETFAKLSLAAQKLMNLKARSVTMIGDEIMREMLLILNFGDEPLEQKSSILV